MPPEKKRLRGLAAVRNAATVADQTLAIMQAMPDREWTAGELFLVSTLAADVVPITKALRQFAAATPALVIKTTPAGKKTMYRLARADEMAGTVAAAPQAAAPAEPATPPEGVDDPLVPVEPSPEACQRALASSYGPVDALSLTDEECATSGWPEKLEEVLVAAGPPLPDGDGLVTDHTDRTAAVQHEIPAAAGRAVGKPTIDACDGNPNGPMVLDLVQQSIKRLQERSEAGLGTGTTWWCSTDWLLVDHYKVTGADREALRIALDAALIAEAATLEGQLVRHAGPAPLGTGLWSWNCRLEPGDVLDLLTRQEAMAGQAAPQEDADPNIVATHSNASSPAISDNWVQQALAHITGLESALLDGADQRAGHRLTPGLESLRGLAEALAEPARDYLLDAIDCVQYHWVKAHGVGITEEFMVLLAECKADLEFAARKQSAVTPQPA